MSAAAVRPTDRPGIRAAGTAPALARPRRLARLRREAARLGPAGITACGFILGLGWAFAGSLWLRLGAGATTDAVTAWRWLAGEGLIGAVTLTLLWLAAGQGPADPR